jgi:hypothetical protein
MRILLPALLALFAAIGLSSFCGFYVAKADTKILNQTSQVIMVRQGDRSVLTMSNDFQGDAKDFAMVVPVPTVLQRDDIRVVEQGLFDQLDTYSGPRLVEYYDNPPCPQEYLVYEQTDMDVPTMAESTLELDDVVEKAPDYKVKIEAQYVVGEYDILILSAEESGGLKRWLTDNGYRIPEGAEEVLDPYIKSNLKFFVVKVDLSQAQFQQGEKQNLRPLQISYRSEKFMLPIRLGMANANGPQDLVVYALTDQGRVETVNYPTVKIPTDREIPEFVQERFGQFYADLFARAWSKQPNATYLEYAWDLSSNNPIHCDPCNGPPPMVVQMRQCGVDWLSVVGDQWNQQYSGNVFLTRLRVRYDRQNFPQDLVFQVTPNKEAFQGRYVMNHPYRGQIDCDEAYRYYKKVFARRSKELAELNALTGWDLKPYANYTAEYRRLRNDAYNRLVKEGKIKPKKGAFGTWEWPEGSGKWPALLLVAAAIGFVWWAGRKKGR